MARKLVLEKHVIVLDDSFQRQVAKGDVETYQLPNGLMLFKWLNDNGEMFSIVSPLCRINCDVFARFNMATSLIPDHRHYFGKLNPTRQELVSYDGPTVLLVLDALTKIDDPDAIVTEIEL